MTDREYYLQIRMALLNQIDAIERRYLCDIIRTAELRRLYKDGKLQQTRKEL